MRARIDRAGLGDIADKLEAGVRLDARRRRPPVRGAGPARRRRAGQPRAREAPRRPHLLQLQPAPRADQRLRGELPVLLVRAAQGRLARRLHDVARAGLAEAARARAISRSPRSTSSTACTRACRSGTTRSCCAGFKRIKPDIHLKAFTAVEIAFFADTFGKTDEQVLIELRAAGLDSLPGGGAEIFAERVRKKICHDKADGERWLSIHRTAHRLGMRSNVHDALRAHRDDRGARRPHAAGARAAGRDRRLPGVHPAGVPPRQQPDAQAAGADRGRHAARPRGGAADAGQHPAHQGVLDRDRRQAWRRRRCGSAPTTSTAPSRKSASTTWPGRTRPRS